jgi:hypothetical protein
MSTTRSSNEQPQWSNQRGERTSAERGESSEHQFLVRGPASTAIVADQKSGTDNHWSESPFLGGMLDGRDTALALGLDENQRSISS